MFAIKRQKQSFYEILGISEDATSQEIKRVYKKLARKYHPDIIATSEDKELKTRARHMMVKLNNAKDTLMEPNRRAEYDIILKESRSEVGVIVEEYAIDSDYIEVFEIDSDDTVETWSTGHDESDHDPDGTDTENIVYPIHDDEFSIDDDVDDSRSSKNVFTFCPNCGAENESELDFCYNCDKHLVYSQLPSDSRTTTGSTKTDFGAEQQFSNIIVCPNCNASNFYYNEFCYFCNVNLRYYRGRVVTPITTSAQEYERKQRPRENELVTCTSCGAGNVVGSIFCRICQADLKYSNQPVASENIQRNVGSEYENPYSSLVVCPNCGAENFEDSSTCYFCHTKLVFYQPPRPPEDLPIGPEKSSDALDAHDSVTIECPNCEREVFPEQTYCYYCGFEFPKFDESK